MKQFKIHPYVYVGIITNGIPDIIIDTVERFAGIKIRANTRRREVVQALQIAMYALKKNTKLSLS